MAKKNPDSKGTRLLIRQTAASLFMQNGVYASSLGDIAQEANLSKGTLYYHYPTKELLIIEIAENYFANITEAIYTWIDNIKEETLASTALEKLIESLNQKDKLGGLYLALMAEALREDGELRALVKKKQKEWAVMLEVGALKLKGDGGMRLKKYSPLVLAIVHGFNLHYLFNTDINSALLTSLLTDD